jgi:DNA replication and repair protein RecF
MADDIKKIFCKNFRSYRTLILNIYSKFVVFYGENGAGKTNILEAVSLFSSEKGLRKAPIVDLGTIGTAALSWNIELELERDRCRTFLSTNVQNGRRVAKIDGAQTPTLSKFEEIMWMLWVIPSMDNIFIASTSDRRSFFDHLVSGYDRKHKNHLKGVADLQRERLHVMFNRNDESWLNVLEEKIAEKSVAVTKSRLEFVNLLHQTFSEYPSDFLRPVVSISGIIEEIYNTNREEDAILDVASMLKSSRREDVEKQSTTVSVQKSKWHAKRHKHDLEAENCSTGEQKAFLISLILAVVRIYKKNRNGTPILLLDDLMVHLDKNRRRSLTKELISLDVQTFFTGTDISFFEDIADFAQIYHVKNSICSLDQVKF